MSHCSPQLNTSHALIRPGEWRCFLLAISHLPGPPGCSDCCRTSKSSARVSISGGRAFGFLPNPLGFPECAEELDDVFRVPFDRDRDVELFLDVRFGLSGTYRQLLVYNRRTRLPFLGVPSSLRSSRLCHSAPPRVPQPPPGELAQRTLWPSSPPSPWRSGR